MADLPTRALASDLGLQVTRFAAGAAIVGAVLAQADLIKALAEHAVFVAGACPFRLVTDRAHEFLGHSRRVPRFGFSEQGTMVDGLAVALTVGVRM